MESLTEKEILTAYNEFLSAVPEAANKSDPVVNNYCKVLFEHLLFRKHQLHGFFPTAVVDIEQLKEIISAIQKLHFPQFVFIPHSVSNTAIGFYVGTSRHSNGESYESIICEGKMQYGQDGTVYVSTRAGGTNHANLFDFFKGLSV